MLTIDSSQAMTSTGLGLIKSTHANSHCGRVAAINISQFSDSMNLEVEVCVRVREDHETAENNPMRKDYDKPSGGVSITESEINYRLEGWSRTIKPRGFAGVSTRFEAKPEKLSADPSLSAFSGIGFCMIIGVRIEEPEQLRSNSPFALHQATSFAPIFQGFAFLAVDGSTIIPRV